MSWLFVQMTRNPGDVVASDPPTVIVMVDAADEASAFAAAEQARPNYTAAALVESGEPSPPGDDSAHQTAAATAAATRTAATNQATLIHERNRWLAQTDPYVLPTASLPSDMPADVLAAIADSANQAAIAAWRQQLRDWPGTVTDWTNPPPLPAPPSIPLPSGRQLIIVT
jgi:hypothetical protein